MDWWWHLLAEMDKHQGQAAWAQAAGSVVSIGAAWATVSWQIWHAERAERRRRAAPIEAAAIAAAAVSQLYQSFTKDLGGKDPAIWASFFVKGPMREEVFGNLREITLRDMPTAGSISALINLRNVTQWIFTRIEFYGQSKAGWRDSEDVMLKQLQEAISLLEQEKRAVLGGRPSPQTPDK
jgi:hypothetical protein